MTFPLKIIIGKEISRFRKPACIDYMILLIHFRKQKQFLYKQALRISILNSKETNIPEMSFCKAFIKCEHLISSDKECGKEKNKLTLTSLGEITQLLEVLFQRMLREEETKASFYTFQKFYLTFSSLLLYDQHYSDTHPCWQA